MWTRPAAPLVLVMLMLLGATRQGAASAQAPGTASASGVCVAVMAPTVTGVEGNAADMGIAVRDLLVSFLAGPSIQPVAMQSRLRVQALEEARHSGCPYLITASLARKHHGGGLGSVIGHAAGSAAGSAAWRIPGASGAAAAARVGADTARAMSDMAASTHAKDEMKVEWTLNSLSTPGASGASQSEKLKASSDGEDILTPLVQHVAESVAETVLK